MADSPLLSLYVGDLDPTVTEMELKSVFVSVGPVSSIRICHCSQTGKSLCYGYVKFNKNSQVACRALKKLNNTYLKGKPMRLMWSQHHGNQLQIPGDITREILLLMPPRFLLRSLSVCKSWAEEIGTKKFIMDHARQAIPFFMGIVLPVLPMKLKVSSSNNKHNILLFKELKDGSIGIKWLPNSFRIGNANMRLKPSAVEGLNTVCGLTGFRIREQKSILIFNPSRLPQLYMVLGPENNRKPFENEKIAIGYDDSREDVFLTGIPSTCEEENVNILLKSYSLVDGRWSSKELQMGCGTYHIEADKPRGIYADRHLHWIGRGRSVRKGEEEDLIVCLDTVGKDIDFINLPSRGRWTPFVYGECFAVFDVENKPWVLETYQGMESTWEELSSCSLPPSNGDFIVSPHCCTSDGEILAYVHENIICDGGFRKYSRQNSTSRRVVITEGDDIDIAKAMLDRAIDNSYASLFVDTLVVPK